MLHKHSDLKRATTPARAKDDVGRLELCLHGASDLPNAKLAGGLNPYVVVTIGRASRRTSTAERQTSPTWNEVMVFAVLLPAGGSPTSVDVQVWDETFTKDELISSATIEIPRMFASGSTTPQRRMQVANLLRPKGDDGGVFRYSMALASVERLEAHVQVLEALEKIPMLPKIERLLSLAQSVFADLPTTFKRAKKGFADMPTLREALRLVQREAKGWKAKALESVDKTSVVTRVSSLSMASLRIAAGVAQSTLEQLYLIVQ